MSAMRKNLTEYDFPAELKSMDARELDLLSDQIRDFLLDKVSKSGGHLASNLGVVELSIALHRVFDSPRDKIIWDVGHQSYVHKLLTGRAGGFDGLRRLGGLSGFPRREESPHDAFSSGHSSNSISAAMGFAEARELTGESYGVVAVIGDGALTGGPAFEGLNNAGSRRTGLIVVLNDNEMSISRSTGGIALSLSRLRASPKYLEFKKALKKLRDIPAIGEELYGGMESIRDTLKFAALHAAGAMFEDLGFKYYGPVDGHSIGDLTAILSAVRHMDRPTLVHVITKKGKGYRNAEVNPGRYHGIGPFLPNTGAPVSEPGARSGSRVFGEKLLEMAGNDRRIVAITAAMADGVGLSGFAKRYPDRFFDVGIAEAHAVSFAAGLACCGLKPYFAVYSTFLQRAYDQALQDVCMQGLPVTFCLDRAGCVGADGETHHGIFDLSYLSHMPNMTVMAPMDSAELALMLEYSAGFDGPLAIRYPKGEPAAAPKAPPAVAHGKSWRLREGGDIDIWAVGGMAATGLAACKILEGRGIKAGLVNARFVMPLDGQALIESGMRCGSILTVEDNVRAGGFGAAVSAFFRRGGMGGVRLMCVAWPDRFIEHGSVSELAVKYGMDAESVARGAEALLDGKEGTA
ncbi:MAG: 1-deoxy-D-xylulose-5-phosphate synthase [Clostridiales Family XIII bacterium]|jgi:1-deoxy-D-xylulose-5-phosphate synthase|nr:1-deoxy-D-xylulose-5-phosphate synthase [Clostridiales Family XIII bacterium]